MYDPAEVKARVEKHRGVLDYRRYIANVQKKNEEFNQERKRAHARLRSIEKEMVKNATALGKYNAYLAILLEQVRTQIITEKTLEARKKMFGES